MSKIKKDQTVHNIRAYAYKGGVGNVSPPETVNESGLLTAIHARQQPIQDEAVVCIDERPAIEKQPVRAKMAGGNVTTGFAAALLSNWSSFAGKNNSDVSALIGEVASHLQESGLTIGAHVHNHQAAKKTGCGAADGLANSILKLADVGSDQFFITQAKQVLGASFNEGVWSDVVLRATDLAQDGLLANWHGGLIINTVRDDFSATVEVLNADNSMPSVDKDGSRHNHFASAVVINTKSGYSNDRDATSSGDPMFFQVDVPAIVQLCDVMKIDEQENLRLLHAATAFQFAVKEILTSNLPNIFIN